MCKIAVIEDILLMFGEKRHKENHNTSKYAEDELLIMKHMNYIVDEYPVLWDYID